MSADEMFARDDIAGKGTRLRFAREVFLPLTETRAHELRQALRSAVTHVACDFSETRYVLSGWWKLIAEETAVARQAGRVIGCVGVSADLRKDADLVGVRKALRFYDTMEALWAD